MTKVQGMPLKTGVRYGLYRLPREWRPKTKRMKKGRVSRKMKNMRERKAQRGEEGFNILELMGAGILSRKLFSRKRGK